MLGFGGVAVLDALGVQPEVLHMNEGHCSLAAVGLIERLLQPGSMPNDRHVGAVRERCVFTTHTPVPAGHDIFPKELVRSVLGPRRYELVKRVCDMKTGSLNMTELGMRLSRSVNGVSLRHGEVSRKMFPEMEIRSVTNGVHAASWAAPVAAPLRSPPARMEGSERPPALRGRNRPGKPRSGPS